MLRHLISKPLSNFYLKKKWRFSFWHSIDIKPLKRWNDAVFSCGLVFGDLRPNITERLFICVVAEPRNWNNVTIYPKRNESMGQNCWGTSCDKCGGPNFNRLNMLIGCLSFPHNKWQLMTIITDREMSKIAE